VSEWTDRTLTMMGEGYKRRMQLISLFVSLAVAVGFNLNTLGLTSRLYRDKEAREALVSLAIEFTQKTQRETFDRCTAMTETERRKAPECAPMAGLIDTMTSQNTTIGKLPIGWASPEAAWKAIMPTPDFDWVTRLFGWALTALAISLGASFWFDLLNRLINIRHGMRRPEVETE